MSTSYISYFFTFIVTHKLSNTPPLLKARDEASQVVTRKARGLDQMYCRH